MKTLFLRLKRLARKLLLSKTVANDWQHIEYFDEMWKQRIKQMCQFISPGESVMDLGCGKTWLKDLLNGNPYYPVDYKKRDGLTHVADFNKHEYPDIHADVAFVSGALEYVIDCNWFSEQIARSSTKCILSYCTTENYPDLEARRGKAWRNHFSRKEVVDLFAQNGMRLVGEETSICNNTVFVFSK